MRRSAPRQAAIVAAILFLVAAPAHAQEVVLSFGEGRSLTSTTVQLFLLVGFISFAPGLLIMATCFPFIVTVLSILRQAIGLQQSPPNMLIVSLALVLTYYVMDPVFSQAWGQGLQPLMREEIEATVAVERILEPFRHFMMARVDPDTVERMAALRENGASIEFDVSNAELSVLVPAFLLSEISTAFEIGFLVFLPFLIIDLVVAAILMSMGMMMVPPALVSLPFKLAFFAIADGWSLISEALVRGYF